VMSYEDSDRRTSSSNFARHRGMDHLIGGKQRPFLRRALRVRRCMICRSTHRLQLHHAGCRVEPHNLSLLCARCHHLVHHIVNAACREDWNARVAGHAGVRRNVWNRVRLGVAAAAFRIDRYAGLNRAQVEMRVLRENDRTRRNFHKTA
jgi:hypothetical protein